MAEREFRSIQRELAEGQITRREFIVKAIGLGVSLSAIGAFLTACAGGGEPAKPAAPAGASTAAAPNPSAPPAAAAPTGEQKLVIAGNKDVQSLDPLQANDADSTYVFALIFDSVLMLDKEMNLKPNLAELPEVSSDSLTYTFKFRKGVKFHDGTELKADDVVFTLDRIMANKYPEGRKKEKIDMIDSYKKVDDYTVQVKVKFPYAPFAAAFGVQYVVPKAVVEKLGDAEFAKNPVGCGPFRSVERVVNDHITLEGFGDYWMVKPKLATVIIRPVTENAVATANLLSGDMDMINDIVGPNLKQIQAAASKGVTVLNKPGMLYNWAGFHMMSPPFTDVRFRQMVYMCTDFDALIKAVFPPEIGTRAYGTVPPGLWPRDEAGLAQYALKQDKAKAKELFDTLVKEGVMAKDYKVQVAPPADDARIKISEAMVTNMKEIGINAEIMRVEWATYTTMLEKSTDNVIYMLGTTPSIPDPDANIRWLFSKDGAHGRYLNIVKQPDYPKWDELITKAQSSQNQPEREQLYKDLQRIMIQQVFHIPLFFKNTVMGSHAYVKEFDVNPLLFWDLVKPWANVYIQK